jgi:hypothetical protein
MGAKHPKDLESGHEEVIIVLMSLASLLKTNESTSHREIHFVHANKI